MKLLLLFTPTTKEITRTENLFFLLSKRFHKAWLATKRLCHLPTLLCIFIPVSGGFAQIPTDRLLTEAEALEMVQAQRAREDADYAARRSAIESVRALDERVYKSGSHKIIVRRVSPEGMPVVAAPKMTEQGEKPKSTPFDLSQLAEETRPIEQLRLSIVLYGDSHSEIEWRDEEDPDVVLKIWSNLSMRYISGLGDFSDESYRYSFVCLPGIIDITNEERKEMAAAELGFPYSSRWKEPPLPLAVDYYEYVVIADESTVVPEKLYRQLDRLFTRYLERLTALEIKHKNYAILSEAREKDARENPIKPKDCVTNYWPGKNSTYLNKQN